MISQIELKQKLFLALVPPTTVNVYSIDPLILMGTKGKTSPEILS